MLCSLVGSAGMAAQKWELAGFGGYQFGGNLNSVNYAVGEDVFLGDLKFEPSVAFGAIGDFAITENVQIEGLLQFQPTKLKVKSTDEQLNSVWLNYYHLGFVARIPSQWNPFVGITGGATHFIPDGDTKSELRGSLGIALGVKTFFNDYWGVRLEGRYIGTYIAASDSFFCSPPDSDNCFSYPSSIFLRQLDVKAAAVLRF
jgi:hypothetical protein